MKKSIEVHNLVKIKKIIGVLNCHMATDHIISSNRFIHAGKILLEPQQ